ncbi:30S ribosomal protein S16 domain protein [Cooperia oncophora]
MVKVKADEKKIDDKARRIAWIGVGEQKDDISTRKFDKEALKEDRKGCSSPSSQEERRDADLLSRSVYRLERRDRLLQYLRLGRRSLTKNFAHSYAQRDCAPE